MSNAKHSPTPWSFDGGLNIFDANGREINCPDCYDDNMRFIVEAVNGLDATLKLKRSLLGWSLERDRLRDLVRRLAEQLHDAVRLTPYDAIARALLREAREAIGEGCR